jgi:hypothetical protein
MLVEARPHSVKATRQLLEGSGPEGLEGLDERSGRNVDVFNLTTCGGDW